MIVISILRDLIKGINSGEISQRSIKVSITIVYGIDRLGTVYRLLKLALHLIYIVDRLYTVLNRDILKGGLKCKLT